MSSRRDFIKTSALLSGSLGVAQPARLPFLPPNRDLPDISVCIRLWSSTRKPSSSCGRTWIRRRIPKRAGRSGSIWDGRYSFPWTRPAFRLRTNIATKPNLTGHDSVQREKGNHPLNTMGIVTDVFFVEGLFNSLKELGVASNKFISAMPMAPRWSDPAGTSIWASGPARRCCPVKRRHQDTGRCE